MARRKQLPDEFERARALDRAAAELMRSESCSFSEAYAIALARREAEERTAARAAARPPDEAEPGDLFER